MAKPPILPIDNKKSYFDRLIEEVVPFYSKQGINLSFEGFKDTLEKYSNLDNTDYDSTWKVGKELNMWSEYLSDIFALNEKYLLDSETEKRKEYAISSSNTDGAVSKGDRNAEKDPLVIKARKTRNLLKSFSTALEKKIDFCNTSYHHCKYTCQWLSQIKGNGNGFIPI